MKIKHVMLSMVAALAISCGPGEPADHKLESIGLKVTVLGETTIIESPKSEYMPAASQFYCDHKGVEVAEMEEASFPTDLKMLEEAMKGTSDVKAITEKKTLPNGAFGVVYDKTDGKKEFLFYFKKGGKYFKITPVGNEDDYADCVTAIGTLA